MEVKKMGKTYKNITDHARAIMARDPKHSHATARTYVKSADQFTTFVRDHTREQGTELQALKNLSEKHVEAYARDMQSRGLSPATMQKNMSAVRGLIQNLHATRINDMSKISNTALGIGQRSYAEISRYATDQEYNRALELAQAQGNQQIADTLALARSEGLRISEVHKIDAQGAREAIQTTGELQITGKGGRGREIPLAPEARETLTRLQDGRDQGEKLLLQPGRETHQQIAAAEKWLLENREKIQGDDRGQPGRPNITWHSFRHSYARDQHQQEFQRLIDRGYDEKTADLLADRHVSELLGHSRPEVTHIYLR